MAEFVGELFWERVDEIKGDKSLRKICLDNGISYDTVKSARLNNRLLSRDNTMKLAVALQVSFDSLMHGDTSEVVEEKVEGNPKLQELISLCKDNPKIIDTLLSVARITLGK